MQNLAPWGLLNPHFEHFMALPLEKRLLNRCAMADEIFLSPSGTGLFG
jgi:hypothetical protein